MAPAYNEEQHIRQFIEETGAVMDGLGLDYEIAVIDDGSTDRTAEIVRHLCSNPRLKLVSYIRNMGKGYAVKQGFPHATGDLIVLIDTDMDISPRQIVAYISVSDTNFEIHLSLDGMTSKRISMSLRWKAPSNLMAARKIAIPVGIYGSAL